MRAPAARSRRSTSAALTAGWLALIVYASLFPFEGWRWPPGASLPDLLRLSWPRWWDAFDVTSNLLGYLPLGLLLTQGLRGGGRRWPAAAAIATVAATALSYALEATQQLLPQRVPSLSDWLLNGAGALAGALLAGALAALGVPQRWRRAHDRWFEHGGGGGIVLLLTWPLALLAPAPVPLGLGQIGPRLRDAGVAALADVAWAAPAHAWLLQAHELPPLSAFGESLIIGLGLLGPCLLAYAASRPSWRRVLLAFGLPVLAAGATTLATALSFGPAHALAWRTPAAGQAWAAAVVLALALARVGPRLAGALALVALTGSIVLVHQAPTDPYYAQNLQAWEQGRFIRFHGLLRWLGWLWPYAALLWLLAPGRQRAPPDATT